MSKNKTIIITIIVLILLLLSCLLLFYFTKPKDEQQITTKPTTVQTTKPVQIVPTQVQTMKPVQPVKVISPIKGTIYKITSTNNDITQDIQDTSKIDTNNTTIQYNIFIKTQDPIIAPYDFKVKTVNLNTYNEIFFSNVQNKGFTISFTDDVRDATILQLYDKEVKKGDILRNFDKSTNINISLQVPINTLKVGDIINYYDYIGDNGFY